MTQSGDSDSRDAFERVADEMMEEATVRMFQPLEAVRRAPIECPRTGRSCRAYCAALDYCCQRRAQMDLAPKNAPGQRRPSWHMPARRWSALSPYDNPHVVWWSEAPRWRRLGWLIRYGWRQS